jgi:hypothetical protein
LEERINRTQLQTGQSVSYEFNIYGEGNISSIAKPVIPANGNFDFYEPNVKQNINREAGHISGTKSFSYFMIPKEPGTYNLGNYFQWVFFNPQTKKYDTLASKQTVTVLGESYKNQSIGSNDLGSFYDRIDATDNSLKSLSNTRWLKLTVNIFSVIVLAATMFFLFKRK